MIFSVFVGLSAAKKVSQAVKTPSGVSIVNLPAMRSGLFEIISFYQNKPVIVPSILMSI